MDVFWKITTLVLITVVLCNAVGKHEKDIAVLISTTACCMAAVAAFRYLEPVLSFLRELEALGQMQEGFLGILLKAAGIGIVAELTGIVCSDAGNASLGKTLHFMGSTVILYLSIPVFRALLTLIQEILGQV